MPADENKPILPTESRSHTNKLGGGGGGKKRKKKKKKKVVPTIISTDDSSYPPTSDTGLGENDPDDDNPDSPEALEEPTEDDDSDSHALDIPGGDRDSISETFSLRKSRLSKKQKNLVILGAAGIIFVAFFVCIGTGIALTEWRHWD